MAVQGTRVAKVMEHLNPRMTGEEYDFWENWAGDKNHPLRAIHGEPNFAKVPLSL